ncbi:hypothetical protein AX17_002783 [Amanita inopinata Kibby_2008]|nr:hypothetical protein AX17_002783 [Amanita inopinata Kibby_2008]
MAAMNNFFPSIGSLVEKTQDTKTDPSTTTEDEERAVEEIESLCMQCHEQGKTRLLLTSIPFFREIIVMSFRCDHCGWQNNEIQSAGAIRPEGIVYTTRILVRPDLDRQLVRSSTCEISIPELELTLPATNRGQLTTVEGLLRDILGDLSMDQPLRRIQDPDGCEKVETLLNKIRDVLGDKENKDEGEEAEKGSTSTKVEKPMPAITIRLDDPAGNSFIEFIGSMADPKWNMRTYQRTLQQNIDLGLINPDEVKTSGVSSADVQSMLEGKAVSATTAIDRGVDGEPNGEEAKGEDGGGGGGITTDPITGDEVFVFPGPCSSCGHHINTLMKKVNIPYFKDILIMSTNCEHCGYRDNEVKSGSAISEKGKKITLKVEDREDLSRDILKSETAGLSIPEIDLVLTHGTLGGRFTTVEGLLSQVYEELSVKILSVSTTSTSTTSDSETPEQRERFEKFLRELKEVVEAERPYTLILDDPLANSYIQNLYAPDPDPNMTVEVYERTWEQNEELGLNDMKV